MELQHLRTFIAVAATGNLTRAAEQLHLTQPAVSGQIKALEHELNVQLFRRASRGMVLTDAGKELLKEAQDVVRRADGVIRLADRLRDGVGGTLRLGSTDCGYDLKLARIIGRVTQQHPEVEVRLFAANSGINVRAILDDQIDLAFIEGEYDTERITAHRIGVSRLGVIGPIAWRDDLIHSGWHRLAEFPWVFQSTTCSHCVLMHRVSEENRVQFRPQVHADAFGSIKNLVAEGLGLSFADLDDAAPLVEEGHIFIWPNYTYDMPVWLIGLKERMHEPLLRTFCDIANDVHRTGLRRSARPVTPPT